MKDHEIAELVNDLRDIGAEYGHTQQLRERISHRVKAFTDKVAADAYTTRMEREADWLAFMEQMLARCSGVLEWHAKTVGWAYAGCVITGFSARSMLGFGRAGDIAQHAMAIVSLVILAWLTAKYVIDRRRAKRQKGS